MSLWAPRHKLSRRDFVVASAAAFASLNGLAQQPGEKPDPAAPRGRQRNLLAHCCTPQKLAEALIPLDRYRPFPTIEDRSAWQAVPLRTRASLLASGEKFLGYAWPEMPATVFLEYARNGNRTHYERIRGARMAALQALTFAECVEAKGRFLDDITNGIWAFCEESFWGVPAHLYIQKADLGLPDPNDPIVDLFAAQTSALLATVVYVLGAKLDTVSPLIRDRVYVECERRIFNPLLKQNFMWMGLPGGKSRHDLPWIKVPEGEVQPVNNWDAWICWNWLTTVLFVDRDTDRRTRGVQKVFVCLDKFINTYPDDGGCEEGPGYWNVAAGAMFDALELLHSATNGVVDIYGQPLLTEMALYMNRVHVAGQYYLNPGDASPVIQLDVDKMYRFGKRLNNPDLIALAVSTFYGAASLPPTGNNTQRAAGAASWPVTLPAVFSEADFLKLAPRKARLVRDTWLPDSHVMAARCAADSTAGLYLACIAADNGKSHSHNDTGNVWVYSNGQPVLIDLGQETYQKASFDSHRYEIPSTQSDFHNLPTIGDVQQGVGPQFRATDLAYSVDDRFAKLQMQLRDAYPPAARLKSWLRSIQLDRTSNVVTLDDQYLLTGDARQVTLNLMVALTVGTSKDTLMLNRPDGSTCAMIAFDPTRLSATVETIRLDNEELKQNWGSQVFRIRLRTVRPETSGRLQLTITAG